MKKNPVKVKAAAKRRGYILRPARIIRCKACGRVILKKKTGVSYPKETILSLTRSHYKKFHPTKFEKMIRRGVIKRAARRNPPKAAKAAKAKPVKIYDRCLAIIAVKDATSNFPKQKFIHRFRKKASIYGLADGTILIKGA